MSAWSDAVAALSPYFWHRLGESSGTTMTDSSGNGRNGTYSGSGNTLGVTGLVPGGDGTALTVTTSSFPTTASGLSLSSTNITEAITIKASGARGDIMIATTGTFRLETAGANVAIRIDTSNSVTTSYASTNLYDGNAHLIVVKITATAAELWVDGALVGSGSHSATTATIAQMRLKSSLANPPGSFDEWAVFNGALTTGQIGDLHTAWTGAAPPPPSVTASTTLSTSGSAQSAGVAAAATSLAVAVAAVAVVGTSGDTTLGVDSSASAYAVGEAVPVTADTTLGVVSSAVVAPVHYVTAATALDVVSSATSLAVYAVTASTTLDVTSTAGVAVGDAPAGTVRDRREGARTRSGYAVASWEPAVVMPPAGAVASGHRRIRAAAFGELTSVLPPTYTVSEATSPRLRTRVMVGGKDISFLNGVPTPEPEYQLAEPLLWGPSSVEIPSIPAAFFDPADYPWLAKGKTVTYQRVDGDGNKVGIDYRGVVVAHDTSGKTLRLEVGGHGQGRAALRHKPLPIFRDTLDLGRLAWAAIRDLGLRFTPRLGPTTGIKQALFGGMDHLSYISELCAKAFDDDGQWSLMPDEGGAYSFARKDRDTVHWTLFNDDARTVADLRSDAAEEPNRVFAGGVTPKGQRVRFGVYPGLKPGDPAPYPFDDDRTFGLGTLDDETDTGDGITVMLRKLWTAGYLSLEEMDGFYDATVTRAVMALQDAAGLSTSGNMNPATWSALFDLDVTGYTLRGSRIEPAAQDYRVRRYNRSASGQVIARNPNFDPSRLIVDRDIDFGSGFTRHRMRDWARSEVYRGEDNWFGTITIHAGGILVGDVPVGASITAADVADVREIRPGQNVRLPMFGGGILLHISGVEISRSEQGHPVARLTVDTQARDAMPVWEQIRRNRETRRDAGRRWKGNRASSQVKDSIDVWDEVGGVLYGDVSLRPGWNVIPVVAGQEGTVSRLRLIVQDVAEDEGEIAIQGREFACAVFGRKVTPKRLRTLIGNPLSASPDSSSEPDPDDVDPPETDAEADDADPASTVSPSRPWWERQGVTASLRDLDMLYSAGTREEPCGYSPGRKTNGGTKTGMHRDDAGFSYRTRRDPVLYVAVWVWGERTLSGGRIMWNQLEAGA
jgi:hypothetical protein